MDERSDLATAAGFHDGDTVTPETRTVSYHNALHRFAVFCAVCTFCLLIAGGLVTSTGASLAVPDWPLAYGMVMPPMVGGILYEHGHRLIASFVGLLTVVLTVWLWRKEERPWVKGLGIAALAAVIAQGLLGGLTVVLLLPTSISVAHATLGQTFFVIVASIALFTSRWWIDDSSAPAKSDQGLFRLSLIMVMAVYVQLILGAMMRHTGSGLAVPDFPLAYGQLFPSLSADAVARYNQQLIDTDLRLFADGAVTASQILLHMIHRIWALVVVATAGIFVARIVRTRTLPARLKNLGYALVCLIFVQIVLGAFTVLTRKGVEVTTAHVVVGALILVTSVQLVLHLARVYDVHVKGLSFVYSTGKALA